MPPTMIIEEEEHADTVQEVVNQYEVAETQEVFTWLASLGGSGNIKVSLQRLSPKSHKGFPCGGTIDSFEQVISEEEIRDMHGGGKFQIRVNVPNNSRKKGAPAYKFGGSRVFEIAGPPKIENIQGYAEWARDNSLEDPVGDDVTSQAIAMAERFARDADARAARLEGKSGVDHDLLKTMVDPLRDQITALTAAMREKDNQIIQLLGKPIDTSDRDRVLDILGTKEDSHSKQIREMQVDHGNQIQAIRAAHDSELRQIRDFNRDELKRKDDRFDREVAQLQRSHDREVDNMRMLNQQALDSQRLAYESRMQGMTETQKRYDRDLNESRTELITLRAKKELSPVDQIQSLVAIKTGFDSLMPAATEEKQSGWQTALETLGPILGGVANRVLPQQQQGAPAAEEMVPIQRPDGSTAMVPRSVIERAKAAKAQQAAGGASAPEEVPVNIDPKEVEQAVRFIEAAYKNQTPPEILAASARNMIPAEILAYLKNAGVDEFLNKVAKIQDGTVLATIDGRMYVRKVAQFLLAGTTEMGETSEATVEEPVEVDIEDADVPDSELPDHPDDPLEDVS